MEYGMCCPSFVPDRGLCFSFSPAKLFSFVSRDVSCGTQTIHSGRWTRNKKKMTFCRLEHQVERIFLFLLFFYSGCDEQHVSYNSRSRQGGQCVGIRSFANDLPPPSTHIFVFLLSDFRTGLLRNFHSLETLNVIIKTTAPIHDAFQ